MAIYRQNFMKKQKTVYKLLIKNLIIYCTYCMWSWQFVNLGRRHQYWKVYTGFRASHVPRHLVQGRSCVFQKDSAKPRIPSIGFMARLRRTRTWVLGVCLQTRPFTNWNQLKHHETKKYDKDNPGLSDKNETTFLSQNSSNWSPDL